MMKTIIRYIRLFINVIILDEQVSLIINKHTILTLVHKSKFRKIYRKTDALLFFI